MASSRYRYVLAVESDLDVVDCGTDGFWRVRGVVVFSGYAINKTF